MSSIQKATMMATDLTFTAVTSLTEFGETFYDGMVLGEHGNKCQTDHANKKGGLHGNNLGV